MNPDLPTPREEIEAKLTALLLGELPANDAFALGRLIEQDPDLAKLYARLNETLGFVREIVVTEKEEQSVQGTPLKLSAPRREKLLAHFKTVKPAQFNPPESQTRRWVVQIAAAGAAILLVISIAIPNFIKSRTTSASNAIINNLRQLNGAKQQWALENHKSESDQPTMADLKPYLKNGLPPVAGEKYSIGNVGQSDHATVRGKLITVPNEEFVASGDARVALGVTPLHGQQSPQRGDESKLNGFVGEPQPAGVSEKPKIASKRAEISIALPSAEQKGDTKSVEFTAGKTFDYEQRFQTARSISPSEPPSAGQLATVNSSEKQQLAKVPRTPLALEQSTKIDLTGLTVSGGARVPLSGAPGQGWTKTSKSQSPIALPTSNNFSGDPQWIGILETSGTPHSDANRFLSRNDTIGEGKMAEPATSPREVAGKSVYPNDGIAGYSPRPSTTPTTRLEDRLALAVEKAKNNLRGLTAGGGLGGREGFAGIRSISGLPKNEAVGRRNFSIEEATRTVTPPAEPAAAPVPEAANLPSRMSLASTLPLLQNSQTGPESVGFVDPSTGLPAPLNSPAKNDAVAPAFLSSNRGWEAENSLRGFYTDSSNEKDRMPLPERKEAKVPMLADLPLAGRLFRSSQSDVLRDTEDPGQRFGSQGGGNKVDSSGNINLNYANLDVDGDRFTIPSGPQNLGEEMRQKGKSAQSQNWGFQSGITRDDVRGLNYLIKKNPQGQLASDSLPEAEARRQRAENRAQDFGAAGVDWYLGNKLSDKTKPVDFSALVGNTTLAPAQQKQGSIAVSDLNSSQAPLAPAATSAPAPVPQPEGRPKLNIPRREIRFDDAAGKASSSVKNHELSLVTNGRLAEESKGKDANGPTVFFDNSSRGSSATPPTQPSSAYSLDVVGDSNLTNAVGFQPLAPLAFDAAASKRLTAGQSQNNSSTLTQDGRKLFEAGKLDEANLRLKQALREDPQNQAAYYYQNLISEARSRQAQNQRELSPRPTAVEVEQAWANPPSESAKERLESLLNEKNKELKKLYAELDRQLPNPFGVFGSGGGGGMAGGLALGPATNILSKIESLTASVADLEISLENLEARTNDALNVYSELVGRKLLRPTKVPGQITWKIDDSINRRDVVQAFDSAFALNGLVTVPVGDQFLKAVPAAQANQSAATSVDQSISKPESNVTRIVQLHHVASSEMVDLLRKIDPSPGSVTSVTNSQLLVLHGKPETVARMSEYLDKLDVKTQEDSSAKTRKALAGEPQPEVSTHENPFSTFSLNVSDVSFKLAAASLEKGQMPDPGSVRSEEFINAFDYRDPEPATGVPVAFAFERARYPFAHNRDLLRFSVKTAAAGRQPGRPLNLVLLLDNSGSMERADRVQIIHEALRVLAEQLQAQDKLSVVTFSRTPRLWVDGISGDQAGKVTEEVSGLTPEGGTNLEEAMNLAYQTAARHYLPNGMNRVVVLTDGAANLGDVQPESLKKKVEAQRKQGIALDCFGIGWEGFNDDLLETLSRNGDGRYGFINTPEEAATEFVGQLAGALQVAASDVKVQVEFNPKRVTAYRQIGYAKHQLTKEQFRDNTVDAAEIGAAESGNALYVIDVNESGEGPLGIVRIRFKIPGTSDYREHEWPLPFSGNAVAMDQASPAMRLAASASAFSEWLVSSPYATEVMPDALLGYLAGVPEVYGADARPTKLQWMIRQAKSLSGK